MTDRRVDHDTFTLSRRYDFPPRTVFAAWAEPAAKRRWFAETEGFTEIEHALDFRVGGLESASGRAPEGGRFTYDAVIHDIKEGARIILAYRMTMDGTPISVSLATVSFEADGDGTMLTYVEQDAFLDGLDNAGPRREGVAWQLEQLALALAETHEGVH